MYDSNKGKKREVKKYDRPVDFLPYIPVTTVKYNTEVFSIYTTIVMAFIPLCNQDDET